MPVRVERSGPVSTVILSRPEVRNAVDAVTADELWEAFDDFESEDDQLVAVLWGEGGTFCSGYDLRELMEGQLDYEPRGRGALGPSRRLLDKPVIAAVDGHAVAGGLELALWCDLRVAGADAIFVVYNRRWGVPLVDGGTVRLPRLIGQGRALDMILTGRAMDADEALLWGLADRVVPAGEARAEAEHLAAQIAAFPQVCMRADRYSVWTQWGKDLAESLADEGVGGVVAFETIADQIRPFFE